MKIDSGFGVLCASFWLIASPVQARWEATILHPPGADASQVDAVDGGRQVGSVLFGPDRHAAMWTGTAEGFVDLHPAGASSSFAFAISGNEQGGLAMFGGLDFAVRWSGTPGSFVNMHPPGPYTESAIFGISGGQFVGDALLGGNRHAGLWLGMQPTNFVDLNAGLTESRLFATTGVSQGGQAEINGTTRAGIWSGAAGTFVDLHPENAVFSAVSGMSGSQQVGTVFDGAVLRGALWQGSKSSFVDLTPAGATSSSVRSTDGRHQVGVVVAAGAGSAVVWTGSPNPTVNLQAFLPPGYTSSDASSITMDGDTMIVGGSAFNEQANTTEAVIWKLKLRAPTVSIRKGRRVKTKRSRFVVRGRATAPDAPFAELSRVEIKAGKGGFRRAKGLENWRFTARIKRKRTPVRVRAVDSLGRVSPVARQLILRR